MNPSRDFPDAWDDDWVDKQAKEVPTVQEQSRQTKRLNKAERRRQQLEFNKKLWEDAETPNAPYFVEKSNDVPLQSGFAPSIKVLSRRPDTRLVSGSEILSANARQGFNDDDEEEEEEPMTDKMTPERRAEKLRKEREEKQRKYDEVRQKIFGQSGDGNTASTSTIDSRSRSYVSANNAAAERPRGRGRGGLSGRGSPSRHLYDPSNSRGGSASSSGRNTPVDFVPIRSPRGPDGSGRGGRGFLNRGGRGA